MEIEIASAHGRWAPQILGSNETGGTTGIHGLLACLDVVNQMGRAGPPTKKSHG